MAKPVPTLADALIHSQISYGTTTSHDTMPDNLRTALNFRLREAKRFVMTEDAGIKIGEAIRSYPDMLAHHGQFAIPPFENCWIELPSRGFHNAVVPGSDDLIDRTGDTSYDSRVGYLFSNNTVYVGAQRPDGDADFSMIAVDLNTPSSFEQELEIAESLGVSRLSLDSLYWGVTMEKTLSLDIKRMMRAQHSIRLLMKPELSKVIRQKNLGPDFIHGCAGEVRNIIGILLMLNQPKHIRYIGHKENYRGVTHHGTKLYLGHSIIEIDLDRKPLTVILGRPQGTHASPREHDVVGNFAHRGVQHGCEHDWIAEDDRHWECSKCHGKRWWRAGHKRGDASKGVVTQERKIIYEG